MSVLKSRCWSIREIKEGSWTLKCKQVRGGNDGNSGGGGDGGSDSIRNIDTERNVLIRGTVYTVRSEIAPYRRLGK